MRGDEGIAPYEMREAAMGVTSETDVPYGIPRIRGVGNDQCVVPKASTAFLIGPNNLKSNNHSCLGCTIYKNESPSTGIILQGDLSSLNSK